MGDFTKPYARRRSYYGKTSTPPRWHRLVGVGDSTAPSGKGEGRLRRATMLCGYTVDWNPVIREDPLEHRSEVKTKSIRCSKCDAAAEKGKA